MPGNCSGRLHVGCIMDGNGRWAAARNLPRIKGHEAGVKSLRRIVTAAPENGVGILSVYAFSSDNWKRPTTEINDLLSLFRLYLDRETENLVRDGVRLIVFGRRDRLEATLIEEIERSEAATQWGDELDLRIGFDYSSREAILAAAKAAALTDLNQDTFGQLLAGTDGHVDVDLLIRTSGEQRLSDFLLWECAYAELYFTDRLWPDFTVSDFTEAVAEFHKRSRRFGALTVGAA